MKASVILPIAALIGAAAARPTDVVKPGPNQVYIKSVSYNGSGCPISPPSAKVVLADDQGSFTVLFDKFIAEAGPDVPRSENRKNCQLNVGIHIPGGFQFSIASADFRGWAQLDAKVSGLQTTQYYFQGNGKTVSTAARIPGPITDSYAIHEEIGFTSLSWSRCGEDSNVNINTAIFVDNSKAKTASGLLTTDSIDGKVQQIYGFQWQKC
ncbi:hypothetical protein PhCBS80983_g01875 [Powellomyces hirtus]|uniref:Secreted protein n=1 Tax=Powellomyces hirtus TaxID=109895 RepID=A0A507E940_9FUNG|nr:secreted protein [Powellomyces hirtus]TPX60316.1 hypothetical protein PhCBS80983_g01875 [Powellomyces hirtus]